MKLCPTCLRCFEDTESLCSVDQSNLVHSRPGPRLIAGKYELDRLLGRGGMGAVYAGTHLDLERPVAIKLLLPDFTADDDALARFKREARAAARLNHPNVADTFDYGLLPDGGAYIVMELVEGQTLREYLKTKGSLPYVEAVKIIEQVADGLEVAHHRGIIHRDIKPSNIILTLDHQGRLQAKIVDFGVAKLKEQTTTSGALTATGSLIGTPRYMSPEQCAGHGADARSDVYSLGVIFYEMLAGRPPFDAPTATALALKHMHEKPLSLKKFRSDVPAQIEELVQQTLDKNPAARTQTAGELADRLREISRTLPATEEAQDLTVPIASPTEELRNRNPNTVAPDKYATQRMNGPTDDLSQDYPEAPDTPSVQGYIQPQEALTKPATLFDSSVAEKERANAGQFDKGARRESTPVQASEPHALTNPPPKGKPKTIWSYTMIVVAIVTVGFSLVAGWLWLRQPAQSGTNSSLTSTNSATDQASSTQDNGHAETVRNDSPFSEATAGNTSKSSMENPRGAASELNSLLNSWVAATNAHDVRKQVSYYAPTVETFYRKRNVPRAAVNAEKSRLAAQWNSIDVRVGEPQISLSSDGRTATMLFHKSWNFTGVENNSGEVVQELRWLKTNDGWKIIGERDVEVIR